MLIIDLNRKEALELELLILGRRVFQDGMAIGVIVQG